MPSESSPTAADPAVGSAIAAAPESTPSAAGARWALAAILCAAAALRLAHWWAVRELPFVASLAVDSAEYDRWAQAIAHGDWLGTAVFFQAPLYPYLVALLYRLFGHQLDAIYLIQIATATAALWALFEATRRMLDLRTALCAAALAAAYGPFLFYDVQLLKESLAASATCFLLWAFAVGRAEPRRNNSWLLAGVLLGILALLRENALLAAPLLLPLAWRRADGDAARRRFAQRGGLLVLGVLMPLAPVALRNGLVGGAYLPTTFQGGVNLYIGNNAEADGTYRPIVPGKQIPELERREPIRIAEHELGRRLDAGEVSRFWAGKAIRWARANPAAFLRLQLVKLGRFWSWYEWPDTVDYYYLRSASPVFHLPLLEFGGATLLAVAGLLLAWRRRLAVFPATLFILVWTLATVVFFLFARYRLPAVPALLVLGAIPLAELGGRAAERERIRLGSAALAVWCLAAFIAPRLAGFAPRMDLVHYNLALLAADAGRLDEARKEYSATLEIDPHAFLAWLNLGSESARARDWRMALACFEQAAALAPDSDDAQSNLGGVELVLGHFAAAQRHLDRALELNPESLQALQNATVLALRNGALDRARAFNTRMLELDPHNEAALRLRQRLAATVPR